MQNYLLFWKKIFRRFWHEDCFQRAAELSYTTLLSLVPLLAVSFSVLKIAPVFKTVNTQIQTFVFKNFVADSAQAVQQHIQSFINQSSHLSAPGFFGLLVTAILLVFTIEQAFNNIWRVKSNRNLVQAFLLYWAVLTLTPILAGVGIAVSSYLFSLSFFSNAASIFGVKQYLLIATPYFLTFIIFYLLYVAVPNCKVKLMPAIWGAVVATLLFELAKYGFSLYITNFPTYKLLYGALATIPIFLVWLYVSWSVILFGAVVSNELAVSGH